MKLRHAIFGITASMIGLTTGLAHAASSFTNTTNNQSFGMASFFGSFPMFFSFSSGGVSITQRIGADGSMCQNFWSTSGGAPVTQLINGNAVSTSTAEPGSADDPCL